jgi:predicted nucleic acid-binding protein
MAGHPEMTGYVLDTSVVFKWISERDETDLNNATRLRRGILEGAYSVTVPDLFFYELANALRYNPGLSSEEVIAAVDAIFNLEFDIRSITTELAAIAVKLAYSWNVTVYDACFLALAQKEKKTLITADCKFYERAKGARHIVRLSDFAPKDRYRKSNPATSLKDFRGTVPTEGKSNISEERGRVITAATKRLNKPPRNEKP